MKYAIEIKCTNETDGWKRYRVYDSKWSATFHSFKERLIANLLLWVQDVKWRVEDRIVEIKDDES